MVLKSLVTLVNLPRLIVGVSSGSGVEFLGGLTADDIDMANNYFIYPGQTGITVNAGATVDRGILTENMFRNVTTPLAGINSSSIGWKMRQNTNIPDSRAAGSLYMSAPAATGLVANGTFAKILGTTTASNQERFVATNNRFQYIGKDPIIAKISVVIGAKAPGNNAIYSLAIAKGGTVIASPVASMGSTTNNQSFQITLNTEVSLVTGDFIEAFVSSTTNTSITVEEMQFRVTD